ncbi:hypothetical protein FRC00_011053 [Tulasnella sp. 408]|nr:hypothetical protein FRC00_011053 [Tulasnella sp. 408]
MAFPRPSAASESVIAKRKPVKPLNIISRKLGFGTSDKNHSDWSWPSSPVTANSICYSVPTPPASPFNPAFEPIPEGKEAR